jgi:hypothetical protein
MSAQLRIINWIFPPKFPCHSTYSLHICIILSILYIYVLFWVFFTYMCYFEYPLHMYMYYFGALQPWAVFPHFFTFYGSIQLLVLDFYGEKPLPKKVHWLGGATFRRSFRAWLPVSVDIFGQRLFCIIRQTIFPPKFSNCLGEMSKTFYFFALPFIMFFCLSTHD